jgi:hypothetical protein
MGMRVRTPDDMLIQLGSALDLLRHFCLSVSLQLGCCMTICRTTAIHGVTLHFRWRPIFRHSGPCAGPGEVEAQVAEMGDVAAMDQAQVTAETGQVQVVEVMVRATVEGVVTMATALLVTTNDRIETLTLL